MKGRHKKRHWKAQIKTISPHTCQNGYHQQEHNNAGKGVEKRGHLYILGGNVNWYSYHGIQYGGFSKN